MANEVRKPIHEHILKALLVLNDKISAANSAGDFLSLEDVNVTYAGNANRVFVVNLQENGLTLAEGLEISPDKIRMLGADFISDGGDNDGAYDGGYNLYIGEEAALDVVYPGAYGVNAFYGYGAGKEFGGRYSVLMGAGSGRETKSYSGGYQANPDIDFSGNLVAVGSSAGRDILKINSPVLIGKGVAGFNDQIFRSCFIGNEAARNQASGGAGGTRRNYIRCIGMGNHALGLANGDHKDVVAIGFESGLYSSLNRSILIGSYSGFRSNSQGGFQADNVIHLGHRLKNDSSPDDLNQVSNTIVIGNDVAPVQENSIGFPIDYDMGLGTLQPSSKLDVAGDIEVGLNDRVIFGDPSTDGSFRLRVSGNEIITEKRESGNWVVLEDTTQTTADLTPEGVTGHKYPGKPAQVLKQGGLVSLYGAVANESGGTIEANQPIASIPTELDTPYTVFKNVIRVDSSGTPFSHTVKVENEQVITTEALADGEYLLLNGLDWLV
ncbi:MAG: hypothetical protein RLP14_05825 [Owenweeksia sp.]